MQDGGPAFGSRPPRVLSSLRRQSPAGGEDGPTFHRSVIDRFAEIAAACDLSLPMEHVRPFGIVGSGAILEVAHLPVYREAGIPVPAIWGRNRARAEELAAAHSIGRVHETLDGLLADPEIAVVDIAVVPDAQVEIALRAIDAGKDVMCQKPLALSVTEAERIVERADQRGRKVAVQQQMRYEEGMAAARAMVERGWIGELATVTFEINIDTNYAGWGWLGEVPQLELWYHTIHLVDTIRVLVGEPAAVFGTQWRLPGQKPVGETRTVSVLMYPGDLRAVMHANHENPAGDNEARFRIDGSDGSIRGTLGLLDGYPHGRTDTLELWSRILPTDGWVPYPVTRRWVPDAFLCPVRSLLRSVVEGGEPETSARDNLRTIRVIEALYRSGETGQVVSIGPEETPQS
jgi:predicted dehydrogenase